MFSRGSHVCSRIIRTSRYYTVIDSPRPMHQMSPVRAKRTQGLLATNMVSIYAHLFRLCVIMRFVLLSFTIVRIRSLGKMKSRFAVCGGGGMTNCERCSRMFSTFLWLGLVGRQTLFLFAMCGEWRVENGIKNHQSSIISSSSSSRCLLTTYYCLNIWNVERPNSASETGADCGLRTPHSSLSLSLWIQMCCLVMTDDYCVRGGTYNIQGRKQKGPSERVRCSVRSTRPISLERIG